MRGPSRITSLLLFTLVACGDDGGTSATDLGTVPDGGPERDAFTNSVPTAMEATFGTQIGEPVSGILSGSDPDGDALTFAITAPPTNGTATLDDPATGAFTYTPNADHVGTDELTYEVSDGEASASATVAIVVHYVSDGTLDATFATGGVQTSASSQGSLSDLTFLEDGRIVVVGNHASADLLMAAFDADGTLDSTFGSGGVVITDVDGGYDSFSAIQQQADGRLIVAGQSVVGSRDFLVAAYSTEGVLDTTFGTNGYTSLDFDGGGDAGRALAILADDSIVVAGYGDSAEGDEDFAVTKLDADGQLDTTFGTDGWASVDFAEGDDRATDMAIDDAGRILVVGEAELGTERTFGVARLTAAGTLDTTFGTDGLTTVAVTSACEANAIALDGDAIWVAGFASTEDEGSMALVALDADGVVDDGFGEGGWVTIDFPANRASANALILRPGGGFLLAGSQGSGGTGVDAAMAALTSVGALDPRFGEDGRLVASYGTGGSDIFFNARRDATGRVVAVGWSREGNIRPLVARFAR